MNYKDYKDMNTYLIQFNQILNNMAYRMLSYKPTYNITIDFIKCMIPHHEAAIYMCQNLLQYTTYYPLQAIAKNIIKTQTNGVQKMKEILQTTPKYTNNEKQVKKYITKYLSITNNMIWRMKHSPKGMNINQDFIKEMIPHHEGAILMCKNLLQYPIDPRLVEVANEIIYEQTKGIRELKKIRFNLKS